LPALAYVTSFIVEGSFILSGGGDSNLRILNQNTGENIITLTDHNDPIRSIVKDDRRLVSADASGNVIIRQQIKNKRKLTQT